mgnify:CR=1 FL=1
MKILRNVLRQKQNGYANRQSPEAGNVPGRCNASNAGSSRHDLATTLADVSDDAFGHFYRSVFYDAELSHFRTFTGGDSCRGDNTGIEYNQFSLIDLLLFGSYYFNHNSI